MNEDQKQAQILVVDDDVSFGKMVEQVLNGITEYHCSLVSCALEALDIMAQRTFDVVITDLQMPNMNGLALTRIIREKYDVSVIIVTGFYNDFNYEEAVENGADDFIEKPVRPTELILRLKRLLRERTDKAQRRQTEEALRKSEKQYRAIFDRAMEGMFQTTSEGGFIKTNQALAKMLGYGSPEELMAAVTSIPKQLCASPEDRRIMLKTLAWSGSLQCYEVQFLRKDGKPVWVSTNVLPVKNDKGQILYYEGNIENITLRKIAEEERETSIKRIRTALGATIQALAVTAETRDPYTAGHQRRVADLARTIATKLGLAADQIDGIRLAGTIHDLGKISVPAEILSMPRKLTEIEFSLIKTHSQKGFDILKDIEFPWPIAQMVLEHHERIDGSGYPNGLYGKDLSIEARIIAVADVVEAIASHRPYRPGFGIAVALDEIVKGKGVIYDSEVAEVCLKLFREDGYQLLI